MGFSISWGSRKAGFLRTTKEVSGRKVKGKPRQCNGPASKYSDQAIVEMLIDHLKGRRQCEIIADFGVSRASLNGWVQFGNRSDLMKRAESLVPECERKEVPRGRPPWKAAPIE